MNTFVRSISLGGGCHWCTEAVFQSLRGVLKVDQGYIAAKAPCDTFSEAVIVHYNPEVIPLDILIEIHFLTHNSTKMHSMRDSYRSAIYVTSEKDAAFAKAILVKLQVQYSEPLITEVLFFDAFKPSREEITNYYQKGKDRPFCIRYIEPKLNRLRETYLARMIS